MAAVPPDALIVSKRCHSIAELFIAHHGCEAYVQTELNDDKQNLTYLPYK